MKFSQDAMLNAAATIVAGRLQAHATSKAATAGTGATRTWVGGDNVSQMLLEAMTEVLGGVELMEEQAKSVSMDLWERLADE